MFSRLRWLPIHVKAFISCRTRTGKPCRPPPVSSRQPARHENGDPLVEIAACPVEETRQKGLLSGPLELPMTCLLKSVSPADEWKNNLSKFCRKASCRAIEQRFIFVYLSIDFSSNQPGPAQVAESFDHADFPLCRDRARLEVMT
jgi:hypothetical protein